MSASDRELRYIDSVKKGIALKAADRIDSKVRRSEQPTGEIVALRHGSSAMPGKKRHLDITLHQLRIFWAVAHSETLTKAAKQLGLAQPSLSQQLSKLEAIAGTRLFDRRSNQMRLTEAGNQLLPKVEHVLRNMAEFEDFLGEYRGGTRSTISISGINSILRVVLPAAIKLVHERFPDIDFNIHDSAPRDVLEMLGGRRVNIGLLAQSSIDQAETGFLQIPVIEDPYVLVVPAQLDLAGVTDPATDLDAKGREMLNQSVQFIFGTRHSKHVEDWYDQMLPDHRVTAQCRSFELAIGLVRSGMGICLAPALSTVAGADALDGVTLYRVKLPPRRIVALLPSQYRRLEPYATLVDALQRVGTNFAMPAILPTPPFLDKPSVAEF